MARLTLPAMFRRPLQEAGFLAATPGQPLADQLGPVRQASPEDDDAIPPLDKLVARSGDAAWLPDSWMDAIAANDDPILGRNAEGLKLYDALLSDDTAMSTLQQRRLAITSREYEVVPGDDKDPRSVKAADDFRAMIDGLGFDRVTGFLHYGVWYGYAVGEGIYTIKEHDGRLIVWLEDIVVPDRRWFGFTNNGELRYITALNSPTDGGIVPDNKFVTIRTGGTHDFAFYGLGLAHWCYWPIFFKRAALKFWSLYLEKRGNPTVAVEFTEADKDNEPKKQQLLGAAVAVGRDSAVLVPEGTLKDERLKILESSRNAPAGEFKDFLADQNEAVMRVVLGQPGTTKGVSSGLNSNQATEHRAVRDELIKADSDLITDAIQTTFGKWVTRWNHGPDVAPPIVRRILDDAEDLSETAKRDVDLDGIGIKRTEDSVKATYGDGYVLERETPEQQAMREQALAAAKSGVVAPAANDNADAARRARVAEFAAQGGGSNGPLYVSRKLLNGADLIAWAKGQGFKGIVPAADLHVTILYSKTPVDWFAMGDTWASDADGGLRVRAGGPRSVEIFGPGGNDSAVVLRFASDDLRWRHEGMVDRGATSDYAEYKPHVTISYDGAGDVDLSKVEPYTGELLFGPEIFEPIREKAFGDDFLAFDAGEEGAIERLIAALIEESSPVFAAMADELRGALQGVSTAEGARVAILDAFERLPIDRLANLTALPLLAERAGASVGADDRVTA